VSGRAAVRRKKKKSFSLQADPTKKAQIFDRKKWSLHWVFLSNTSLKPAKVEFTPLPQWYYSFLIKKFLSPQARRTSQQTTLEAISRDIERGLTCCKDQYFQEKFDPCLAGAKYFF
jgi:hypothetical protein